jgi:hypothetical protein
MKLVEFLRPLGKASQQTRILAAMYFLQSTTDRTSFTASEIREALRDARTQNVRNWNITARLGSAGHLVHADGAGAGRTWELTASGVEHVESLDLPGLVDRVSVAQQSDAAALRAMVAQIADPEARAFASEAVDCLEVGAYRAAIVFMWVAAVHQIQERVWAASTAGAITAAAQKQNPKAKLCKKRDDLVEYNEALLLQIAQDVGVIDKNEKAELVKALGLRNSSGHPNKLRPGEHRAKAHIEDIVTMLFK